MSKEEQEEADCDNLIFTPFQVIDFKSAEQPLQQPFVVPREITEQQQIGFDKCQYRFYGEAQVADTGFVAPEMIVAHIVIFDCDNFGVIYHSF